MSGDGVGKEAIFLFRPGANVVYDQWAFRAWYKLIRYYADVWERALQHPGHNIAGLIVGRVVARAQALAVSVEKGCQVRNPAVIDVGVWSRQAPSCWVAAEAREHVLVHSLLQIDIQATIGPNN